ncbi:cell surface protein [Rhizobium leguminosarum]|uniref:cell surface protein n=1 Tax=Rhizobium leguminosarum TaxID=384 RepID=UPI002E0DAE4E|nr:cell surface protein [Rhizobium leguminosarum]
MNAAVAVVANAPKYMNSAIEKIKELGLSLVEPDSSLVAPLVSKLAELDNTKALVIGRTLTYQGVFAEMADKNISAMTYGSRFEEITESFNSIVEDMQRMVGQAERNGVSFGERFGNLYMKVSRGDVAYRFDKVQSIFKDVMKDSLDQARREEKILAAYVDYRGALKEASVLTFDLMTLAQEQWDAKKAETLKANDAVVAAASAAPGERARLELARDEAKLAEDAAEARWQSTKRISENLETSYNVADMTFKRLEQIIRSKNEVVDEGNAFFSTNQIVFTALKVTVTGYIGLHEATQSVNAMKEGRANAINAIADSGDKLLEAATTAAYTSTDNATAAAMKNLIEKTVSWQVREKELIAAARKQSSENTAQIAKDAEEGRQRLINASAEAAAKAA